MNDKEEQIVKIVYTFERITAEQIAALLGMNTIKYVRDHYLRELCKEKYLHRFLEPTTSPGIKPFIYRLGQRGIDYLKEQDFLYLPKRFNPSNESSYATIRHNLDINEFVIAAILLTRTEPIQLTDIRHDSQLQHTPLLVKGSETETFTVKPDAFLNFQFQVRGKDRKMPILLELDTGSETNVEKFKEKIRNILLAFLSPEYEKLFGTAGGTIAFATTRAGTRLDNMRKLTYQELHRLGHLGESGNFLFTRVESFDKSLFLEPVWYLCDDNNPVSLLDFS